MAQDSPPIEIGLAEFLTRLVSDASEAFLAAQHQQQNYYSELDAAIAMEPSEFAKAIPEAEVDRELANLFPSKDPAHAHAIFVDAPYQPQRAGALEDPPIQKLAGVRLVQESAQTQTAETGGVGARAIAPSGPLPPAPPGGLPGGTLPPVPPGGTLPPAPPSPRLTQQQVQQVRDAVQLKLGVQQQTSLAKVLAQPRIRLMVDSTRILAKVGLVARADQPTSSAKPSGTIAESVQNAVKPPRPLRLSVRMVDDKAPQTAGTPVDIYSEIELHLKSIVL